MSIQNQLHLTWFFTVLLSFQSHLVSAQGTSILQNEPPLKSNSFSPFLKVDISALSYTSESTYDQSQQQKVELELGFKKEGFVFTKVQGIAGTFSETNSFFAAVPEAFVGVGTSSQEFVAVGRYKKKFNFLDSFYHLGLYNPYVSNDLVDYRDQGLTGLHLQMTNGIIGGFVGWHPYYLPNQGPQVHEQGDGTLASSNRWAARPPTQFRFIDETHPIDYAIRDYSISEIIQNQGAVASIFLGPNVDRPWLQISYANHPLNEIPLSRETFGTAKDFVGHVQLSPIVTYHEVKSADINLDFKNFQTTLSYAEDSVKNEKAAQNETLQSLNPLKIYGLFISSDLSLWARRQLTLILAVSEFEGGEISDLTQDGTNSVFTFSNQRTQFKSPTTLGLTTEILFIRSRPLRSQVSWIYDRTFKGSLVSAQFRYEAIPHLNLHLGADVIGVEQEAPAEDASENFLARTQANDRVYGGVQYEF